MKVILKLFILLLTIGTVQAQQKTITGKVILSDDTSSANVNILTKKSKTQARSTSNGNFMITVNLPDTLVFSHLNYKTLVIPIDNDTSVPLLVNLTPDVNVLQQVMISTGYQTLPKERSTGSFSTIDNLRFNEQVGTDVLGRLEGIANGLSVSRKIAGTGNSSQIMVRGLSTIQGVKQPLIIVDNFPYEGDINNINPNEVQDITILKDAAAASIWGTKAGNGVIVITTKKGTFNQPVKTEFNTNLTLGSKPDLFYLPFMSSAEMVSMEEFLFSKNFRVSDTNNFNHPAITPVYEALISRSKDEISAGELSSFLETIKTQDYRNELLKYQYKEPVNQQYSINFSGGSKNHAWSVFGGYDKNISDLDAKYDRLNLRTQQRFNIFDNIQLSIAALYTHTTTKAGRAGINDLTTSTGSLPIYSALVDENGNELSIMRDLRQSYTTAAAGGKMLNWNFYPLTDHEFVNNTVTGSDLLANLGLQYKIFKSLSAVVNYQYEIQQQNSNNLRELGSYYTRNLINSYSSFNQQFNSISRPIPVGDILDQSVNKLRAKNLRGQLNFDRQQGKFSINAIAGAEVNEKNTELNSNRTYGFNQDILTSVQVDYARAFPNFVNGNFAFIPNGVNFFNNLNRFVSVYVNGALTYADKLTLSLSGRRDASNLFGVNENNRWTPLWSSGLAWELSREEFYKFDLIPSLKLRATYGFSGNINPNATAVTTLAFQETSPYTQTPTAIVDKFYNPDLKWEKVGMFNAGIDFKFKDNWLTGSLEFYQKNATDLFGSVPIDYTTGLGTERIIKNVAKMAGQGLDLELNSVNVNTPSIKWQSNLNLNYYKDEVKEYFLGSMTGGDFINGGQLISAIEGRPVYAIYAFKSAGLNPENGDPQGYLNGAVSKDYLNITGNGTSVADLRYVGHAFPVWFGSLGNTISYKNISMSFRINYKFGYYFQKSSINYSALVNNRNGHSDYAKRWQQSGDELSTEVPSFVYPVDASRDIFYNSSEALMDRADNIRLQYINLNYHIPFGQQRSSNLSLYVVANNLGLMWTATDSKQDPDYNNFVIPPSRTISIGLRTNF